MSPSVKILRRQDDAFTDCTGNDMERYLGQHDDNFYGCYFLSVQPVIALITTANHKNKQSTDHKHNDKASLPNFIGYRELRNTDDGRKNVLTLSFQPFTNLTKTSSRLSPSLTREDILSRTINFP